MSTWSLKSWEQNLRSLPTRTPPLAAESVEAAARNGTAAAVRLVPVKTGRLRASIGIGETTITHTGASATFEARTDYAAYVEYGTARMAPRAYMRTAAREVTPGFKRGAEVIGVEALVRSLT